MSVRRLADHALGGEKVSVSTYVPLLILFWTLVIGASLACGIRQAHNDAGEHARDWPERPMKKMSCTGAGIPDWAGFT